MIGRTVTTALALTVERNPLAPMAVSASHFARPGTKSVSMRLEASYGSVWPLRQRSEYFSRLRKLHAALRAAVTIGFFGVVPNFLPGTRYLHLLE
jgi:hypothetical protein